MTGQTPVEPACGRNYAKNLEKRSRTTLEPIRNDVLNCVWLCLETSLGPSNLASFKTYGKQDKSFRI